MRHYREQDRLNHYAAYILIRGEKGRDSKEGGEKERERDTGKERETEGKWEK